MDEDERVVLQDERLQRFQADCEQRRLDGQREITFDDWVRQYEWRYDAEERQKARAAWPECFSYAGAAPLPVEDWEVDYLTHKEIDKIMYQQQTQLMSAQRREREGKQLEDPAVQPGSDSSSKCRLEVDKDDEQLLREAVVKKGYRYWW